ncbi:MAG: hypothetical protein A3C43_04380 [Candidatus Schekmanbacteria bacterium RIFCSPHIGHO2_02_FULL_38_11]|uniref:Uncharacterized protein n=1 Tax=Candidatus Schekmanbacteria bacterium RIFCSPLOWO2_12_FULL_38_15 TaxID=1817883 RepID=A0A1F7SM40_9BACT|nr:MAG: hypothetical protein A2043_01330 [Candidatus Schekmanbacteria bacterium GWA2_38_9]OGL48789.1 MAG: hypothetical protein A3C43_04380 [Candidatus Schekmanbacteria bacterium RIFCSPHIGHO2_02_FULL_38_11]OGL51026.1 MAG: hypothetical protein A3H37_11160 [Candidatus Schekmanbacteria bacterium RIFCSPLOWO2_02_FULL_38_14]OGL54845.1 MAG: hypothetical protein A3G31_01850 [Candidatus Schekmanbacteria bacterium RIFCSPLOWO2_12_FULL_38_15]
MYPYKPLGLNFHKPSFVFIADSLSILSKNALLLGLKNITGTFFLKSKPQVVQVFIRRCGIKENCCSCSLIR